MRPWWQRYPDRWQAERDALRRAGARYRVDVRARAAGRLRLHLTWPAPDGTTGITSGSLRLVAVFPDTYPFFPPDVIDTGLSLPRHRHPTTGHLCLVHAEDWDVDTTLAAHLAEQLPKLLPAAGGEPSSDGDGVPEPVTLYGPVAPCSMILVDGDWQIPADAMRGALVATIRSHGRDIHAGAVTHVAAGRATLGRMSTTVARSFDHPVAGRWVRLPDYDPAATADELWDRAHALLGGRPDPEVASLPRQQRPHWEWARQRWQLVGLLINDQLHPGQRGPCWLFLLRHRPSPRHAWRTDLVQSGQVGPADLAVRRPETTALANRSVILVGAGALGGVIATELARAGLGQLHIVDGDIVDPATLCRQVGTLALAGLPKATAIAAELGLHSPHTVVLADPRRIGNPAAAAGEHATLSALVLGADLVIDATANPAASRYLAALAGSAGTAFLHASATAGGHGGLVVRIRPGHTAGCWACLAHHRADHTVPAPPAAADGLVHPARCTQPTFTGTGTDLATIAMHAARLAIGTLVDGQDGGYPDFDHDVHAAALRDTSGRVVPATWHTADLHRHHACPLHPDADAAVPDAASRAGSRETQTSTAEDQPPPGATSGPQHAPAATPRPRAPRGKQPRPCGTGIAEHRAQRTLAGRSEEGGQGRPRSTHDHAPPNATEERPKAAAGTEAEARDESGSMGGERHCRRPEHRRRAPRGREAPR